MTAELDAGRQFVRTLRQQDGRTLIASTCKQCGEVLVGSVLFNELLEQERLHTARCPLTATV